MPDIDYFCSMLSKKTKYGLKALSFIACQEAGVMVPITSISEQENISRKFLEIILLSLKKAGFLGAKKGKGGGYYLRKQAADIKMTDVIRHLEGPIALIPCASLNYYEKCDDCVDEASCGINKMMMEVRDRTLEVFRNTSLADLANCKEDLLE